MSDEIRIIEPVSKEKKYADALWEAVQALPSGDLKNQALRAYGWFIPEELWD